MTIIVAARNPLAGDLDIEKGEVEPLGHRLARPRNRWSDHDFRRNNLFDGRFQIHGDHGFVLDDEDTRH
jgi:hypothetical protein